MRAKNNPLTGYEPKLFDRFRYSETSEMIFQNESVDIDTEQSYSCEAELDDEIIGKALQFVPKTEVKSRNGKRKNQDFP